MWEYKELYLHILAWKEVYHLHCDVYVRLQEILQSSLVVQFYGCNQVVHDYVEVHLFHNSPYEMVKLFLVGYELYSCTRILCAHVMDTIVSSSFWPIAQHSVFWKKKSKWKTVNDCLLLIILRGCYRFVI